VTWNVYDILRLCMTWIVYKQLQKQQTDLCHVAMDELFHMIAEPYP